MSEIWNLSSLCRCCHKDGEFTDLRTSFNKSDSRNYITLLKDTFDISMELPQFEASYSICDSCIGDLIRAYSFKSQVLKCEQKFQEYYLNELASRCDLKVEKNSDTDDDNSREPMDFVDVEIPKDIKLYDVSKVEDKKAVTIKRPVIKPLVVKKSKHKKPKTEGKLKKENGQRHRQDKKTSKYSKKKNKDAKRKLTKNKPTRETEKTLYPELEKYIILEKNIGRCKICNHIFKFRNYIPHLRLKHKVKVQYKCDLCQKIFHGEKMLISHKNTHKNSFTCKKCSKKFVDYDKLVNHFLLHDQLGFICDLCGQNYKNKDHLRSHLQRKIICKLCGSWFNNKTSFSEHLCTQSKEGNYICEICNASCNTEHKLNAHKLTHELKNKTVFICKNCGAKFYKFTKYVNHYVKNHMNCGFFCDFCMKEFRFKMSLQRHLALFHYGVSLKKVVCEICGHSFNDKAMYMNHMRQVHENLRAFSCKLCPLTFKTASCLKIHIRRHVGDKPYRCDQCEKAFVLQSYLKRHKMVHAENKLGKRKRKLKKGQVQDYEVEIDQFKSGVV